MDKYIGTFVAGFGCGCLFWSALELVFTIHRHHCERRQWEAMNSEIDKVLRKRLLTFAKQLNGGKPLMTVIKDDTDKEKT